MLEEGENIVISADSGVVRVIEVHTRQMTDFDKFRSAVTAGMVETPVLPSRDGTIMMRIKGKWSVLFIQQPPRLRNIQYLDRSEDKLRVFTLAFPWMILGLKFQGNGCVDVFSRAAKSPVVSTKSELVILPLPNSDELGKRCMGQAFGMTVNTGSSIAEVAVAVQAYFDGSTYNRDLPRNTMELPREFETTEFDGVLGALEAWARWTEKAGKKWPDIVNVGFRPAESFGVFASRLPI
jgi:hypothetical protein